jgi:hypothetical protein
MKKIYLSLITCFSVLASLAQNPGLIISEFYQNPSGSDSPYEYIEFLATDDIDFSVTPFSIIVCNNGTATASGWLAGGPTTYAFEITTGTVSIGDVVYVGGTLMAPTGTILRAINTGVDGGDGGIGNPNSGGVVGNGGTSADGIAVFNLPLASITPETVPTDAIFYGTGIAAAFFTPTEGYELPTNDFYAGGKLQADSYYTVDEDLTVATSGVFDLLTNTFIEPRVFGAAAATDGVSEIIFGAVAAPKFSFVTEDVTLLEDADLMSFDLDFTGANGTPSSVSLQVIAVSTAENVSDYILMDTTITVDGLTDGTYSFEIQIEDDGLEENSEYVILAFDTFENAEAGENDKSFIYITDNDRVLPTATNELKLELLTSFSTGIEGESSAEIVVFDPTTQYLFIVNSVANQIDIVDLSVPALPLLIDSIEFDSVGFINSVAIYNDIIAVAVAAPVIQDSGFVSFWGTDGTFLNRLTVGALPDMVTFNHTGTQLIAACEGEPNADYSVDPNGGVAIIDIVGAIEDLTASDVTVLNFTAFDGDIDALKAAGVRIFGPGSSVAQDFEPEYVTVMDDDQLAYVVLQENNAMAVVNIATKTILEIRPLGTIDHSLYGYGLDASNSTSDINIANFPIRGMFLPDAISHIGIGGTTYLFTANEGDSRDYDGYSEEERVRDLDLDPSAFPDAEYLQNSLLLGRLKTTSANGDTDGDGDFDEIYTYGTRSFSIWDEATGALVFDSGDMIEQIIVNHPIFSEIFNASNEDSPEAKDRSDDKGPEPEGITAEYIDGNAFLFVSLERIGGVMVFNINDPANPVYIGYHNNRDAITNGPDRGAEGMIYIDPIASPSGNGILILANEISSTLTIFEVNSCQVLSDLMVTTTDDATAFCTGDSLELTANSEAELLLEWQFNGELTGEDESSLFVSEPGYYQVHFINEIEGCMGLTDSLMIDENELPLIEAFASADSICNGESVIFSSTGAPILEWETAGVENDIAYLPIVEGEQEYMVIGTDENGCQNTASVLVNMAAPIEITYLVTDEIFGSDASIDISVTGGFGTYAYDWNTDELGDFDDSEDLSDLEAGSYIVTVQDEFGCEGVETIELNSQVNLVEEASARLSVYPNPVSDQLTVNLSGSFDYTLVNVNGEVINSGKGFNSIQFSVSDLATGLYFIQVTAAAGTVETLKITKF